MTCVFMRAACQPSLVFASRVHHDMSTRGMSTQCMSTHARSRRRMPSQRMSTHTHGPHTVSPHRVCTHTACSFANSLPGFCSAALAPPRHRPELARPPGFHATYRVRAPAATPPRDTHTMLIREFTPGLARRRWRQRAIAPSWLGRRGFMLRTGRGRLLPRRGPAAPSHIAGTCSCAALATQQMLMQQAPAQRMPTQRMPTQRMPTQRMSAQRMSAQRMSTQRMSAHQSSIARSSTLSRIACADHPGTVSALLCVYTCMYASRYTYM